MNNKRFLLSLCVAVLLASSASAQNAHFPVSGVINFEKTINAYAIIKKNITKDNEAYMQQVFDQYKKTQPQFKKLTSTLAFSKDKTLFKPIIPELVQSGFLSNEPAAGQPNTILTDLASSTSICQKKVFEETFLVKDSVRAITWKITDETREIAGFNCRRANAVIMDSIYVVAFYTDEIPVSGGPESFAGLPGMILGVALPHENTTWFATKVSERPVTAAELTAPAKGKVTTVKGLKATMQSAFKDWGSYAQSAYKALLL